MIRDFSFLKYVGILLTLSFLSSCTSIRPISTIEVQQLNAVPQTFTYDSYADVLQQFAHNGLVDYGLLIKNPESLEIFYAQIAAVSPDSHPQLFPTKEHRLAYWINAYNASVLKGVTENYPIDSVADVEEPFLLFFFPSKSGFFFFQRFTYGGKETSLYYLENGVIRDRFREPRIHFALNCASQSCPDLPGQPFVPEKLETQLDYETKKFINDKEHLVYDKENNILYLSSIFKWYKADFVDHLIAHHPAVQPTLVNYVLLYLETPLKNQILANESTLQIDFLPYDWKLNNVVK